MHYLKAVRRKAKTQAKHYQSPSPGMKPGVIHSLGKKDPFGLHNGQQSSFPME